MKTLQERKTELEARRAELLFRINELEQELESHESKDWEDLATEREGDEVLEQIGMSASTEIIKIDAALRRIETDEYGFCVKCGAEISQKRLDMLPFTPFCRNCAT